MNTIVSQKDTKSFPGLLILVVGPTASGKNSLLLHVTATFPEIARALTCVTRVKRPGEVEGETYYFISDEEFERRRENGEFLEWVKKDGGHKYGTLASTIIEPLEEGKVVIRDIDAAGVEAVVSLLPRKNIFIISIDAGPWEMLEHRLKMRAPITPEELEHRHQRYLREAPIYKKYADVVVQNPDGQLEKAKQDIVQIVRMLLKKYAK